VRDLSQVHGDPVFDAQPLPAVLLDGALSIRAVNAAYARAVGRSAEELLGRPMFEAFPDNPDDPDADGVANLTRSFELVARHRRVDNMVVQRYDIEDLRRGGWRRRVWSPVTSPIVVDEKVVGLMHQVRDITPAGADLQAALRQYRDLLLAEATSGTRVAAELTDAVAAAINENEALASEVLNLRRALTSRATIDQAKGIVMAERHCTPDEAFATLVKLSSDSNVKLADVALALVYKAQRGGAGAPH
jgi:PAS domain S-box-containing protein